jgi:hypothetical protein
MRRSLVAVLASCVALGGAVAPSAGAQAAPSATSVTINFVNGAAQDLFRGRVGSPNPACREDRLVRLFFVQPGADARIDSDRSEDNGAWDIDVEGGAAPGRYYARVTANANCQVAMSRIVTVP